MSNKSNIIQDPIAVVGMACLFPGAIDLSKYWDNILSKRELFTDIPKTHWLIEDFYDSDIGDPDKSYCNKAALLPALPFDFAKFGIPPNILPHTDSSQLLGLIVTEALLKDAFEGDFSQMDREKVSVILGSSLGTVLSTEAQSGWGKPIWFRLMRECGVPEEKIKEIYKNRFKYFYQSTENTFPGLLQNVIAGRIANRFDLHGTNCVIDAACASSLGAFHLSVKELLSRDSDLVLTGGIQTVSSPLPFLLFSNTPALSFSGNCRPFDEASDGTMLGEGVGFFALRRLEDAERDGNRIYAVLRGIGTSSDGKGKSIYAPEAEGQIRALRRAYQNAGYGPETVELMEAHGTGTVAGDAAELKTLQTVFSETGRSDPQWCALGSIKSQIGHCLGAAGAASMMKTILALHHKILPPTLHVDNPSKSIDFENSPLYVNTQSRPWIHPQDYPRRASLSSFGFGGTNFHITLEEYRGPAKSPTRRDVFPEELILISGDSSEEALNELRSLCQSFQEGESLFSLSMRSLENFNPKATLRLAVVVSSGEELAKKIPQLENALKQDLNEMWLPPLGIYFHRNFQVNKIAFLFPGQGSQYLNMGSDLAMGFDSFRKTWDQGDGVSLEKNFPLSRVVFPLPTFSEEALKAQQKQLTQTQWAQPALGMTSAALISLLNEMGLKSDFAAGHSFGEITALHYAGCFDLATLLKIARCRGELMAQASDQSGGMLAVAGEAGRIQKILNEMNCDVLIANDNAPDQCVLSGKTETLPPVQQRLEMEGFKVTPLQVSTAFHSPLVWGCTDQFQKFLEGVDFQDPQVPVYSNTTTQPYPREPHAIRKQLAEHLAKPVRFREEIENLYQAGANLFVEVGPGSTLTGLVKKCLGEKPYLTVNLDQKKKHGISSILHGVGQLSVAGLPLNLDPLRNRTLPLRHSFEKNPGTIMISSVTYQRKYPLSEEDPQARNLSKDPEVPRGPSNGIQKLMDYAQSNSKNKTSPQTKQTNQKEKISAQAVGSDLVPSNNSSKSPEMKGVQPYNLKEMPRPNKNLNKGSAQSIPSANSITPSANPKVEVEVETPPAKAETAKHIKELFMDVISEKTGYPKEILSYSMDLESDLGIDSIKRVEIFLTMKEKVPELPEVPLETLAELATIEQIITFMENHIGLETASKKTPQEPISTDSGPSSFSEEKLEKPIPSPPSKNEPAGEVASQVQNILLEVISQLTGYPLEILNPQMDLEADLGIDSIKRMEVFVNLNEKIPNLPEVELEQLVDLKTIEQINQFISQTAKNFSGASSQQKPVSTLAGETEKFEVPSTPLPIVPKEPTLPPVPVPYGETQGTGPLEINRYSIRPVSYSKESSVKLAPHKKILLVGGEKPLASALSKKLSERGIANGVLEDEKKAAEAKNIGGVVYLGGLQPLPHFYGGVKMNKQAFHLAKLVAKPIQEAIGEGGGWWITVQDTGGDFGLSGKNALAPLKGGLAGLTKTISQEWKGVYAKAIDCPTTGKTPEQLAEALANEILKGGEAIEVGVPSGGDRITLELEKTIPTGRKKPLLNENSVLVVSGGARGITSAGVVEIARTFHPKIVLFGRSPVITEEPDYLRQLNTEGEIKKVIVERMQQEGKSPTPQLVQDQTRRILQSREVRKTISELEKAGSPVKYYAVDILESRLIRTEGPSWTWKAGSLVRAALAEVRQEWGPLHGLIHGAGVIQDKLLQDKTPQQFDLVFDTKVLGLSELLSAMEGDPLNLILLYSSVAARHGNRGQCDYAMANEVLNKIAQVEQKKRGPDCMVKAINWGPWEGGLVDPTLQGLLKKIGIPMIPLAKGTEALIREINDESTGSVEVLIRAERGKEPEPPPQKEPKAGKFDGSSFLDHVQISKNSEGVPILKANRIFDPDRDRWLQDHCPTYTFPTMPLAGMVGLMKEAALKLFPELKVVGFEDLRASNWLSFDQGPREVKVVAEREQKTEKGILVKVSLQQYRKAQKKGLSRFEPFCTGKIYLDSDFPASPEGPQYIQEPTQGEIFGKFLYQEGYRFHGPQFQVLDRMLTHPNNKGTAFLKARGQGKDRTLLSWISLVDGVFQALPQEESPHWLKTNSGRIGYPIHLEGVQLFKDFPESSHLRVEYTFLGFHMMGRSPKFEIRVYDGEGEKSPLWAKFILGEILVEMGRWAEANPRARREFLKKQRHILPSQFSKVTQYQNALISISDLMVLSWLPGTIPGVYLTDEERKQFNRIPTTNQKIKWLAPRMAAKEMISLAEEVHPSTIEIKNLGNNRLRGISHRRPLNQIFFQYEFNGKVFRVKKEGGEKINRKPIADFLYKKYGEDRYDLEKIIIALGVKFLKEIVLEHPAEYESLKGKPRLYLANHQTYIESLIFSIISLALGETPILSIAKKEQQVGWLGKMNNFFLTYPGLHFDSKMHLVDRNNPNALFEVFSGFKKKLLEENLSLQIHVEGKRALKGNQEVKKITSLLLDLSIQAGIPILPVRFRGGLPLNETGRKYDFPVGYGKQSIYIGKPLYPSELENIPYAERAQKVKDAINQLGGVNNEFPEPPDEEFEQKVQTWREYSGCDEAPAVIYQSLLQLHEIPSFEAGDNFQIIPEPFTRVLFAGKMGQSTGKSIAIILPDNSEGKWLRSFAEWILGPKGPKIFMTTPPKQDFEIIVKGPNP